MANGEYQYYKAVAENLAQRSRKKISYKSSQVALDVKVQSGLLDGAESEIIADSLLVGCGPDANLFMPDEGIVAEHVRVENYVGVLGHKFEVTALAPNVEVDPYGVLDVGATKSVRGDLKLQINGVSIYIAKKKDQATALQSLMADGNDNEHVGDVSGTETQDQQAKKNGTVSMARQFGINIVLPCSLAVLGLFLVFSQEFMPTLENRDDTQATLQTSAIKPNGLPKEKLLAKIEEADFEDFIAITPQGDGSLHARGSVRAARLDEWRSIMRWFDGAFPNNSLVSFVNEEKTQQAMPRIASVNFSDRPNAILDDGQVLFIGDKTANGWRVEDINRQSITLHNGSRIVKINF